MVSLDRFELFCAVVEAGSFTAAAVRLCQTRAAVSFGIKQLEAQLGVTLLVRTTRRVALTDAGEGFYRQCVQVLEQARVAIEQARAEHGGLQGSLRITSTVEYGLRVVAPALQLFMREHPLLAVRLETHTAQVDLVQERFDVAIRLGQPQDSGYRGVCLETYAVHLVTAPGLCPAGAPLEAVSALPWLAHSRFERQTAWTVTDARGEAAVYEPAGRPVMVADNASILRAFALQGMGAALLPAWLIEADLRAGRLVDVLAQYRFAEQSVYALYPASSHVPRKVRAWIDFLKGYVGRSH